MRDRARDVADGPVKGSGQDEVVVDAQLVQTVREIFLVDQTAGFVDYDERVDDPEIKRLLTVLRRAMLEALVRGS